MGLMVFVGGVRSGKSRAAEAVARKLLARGERVTVAVFGDKNSSDEEFLARIERHQRMRPQGFATLEAFDDPQLIDRVPSDEVLVIDCLGAALTACLWGRPCDEDETRERAHERWSAFLRALVERSYVGKTIVVTSEVGLSLVADNAAGREFQDLLGRANEYLVGQADAAYLVVCGRLVNLHSCPGEVGWIED